MARDERKMGSGRETEINRERQTEVKRETRRERKVFISFFHKIKPVCVFSNFISKVRRKAKIVYLIRI